MLWQFFFLFCQTRGSWLVKVFKPPDCKMPSHPYRHLLVCASYAAAHFKLQNNSNESNWIKSHQYGWKCRLEVKQQIACLFQLHATLNLSLDAVASLFLFFSAFRIFLLANSFWLLFGIEWDQSFFLNPNHENHRKNITFAQHTHSASFIPSNGKLNYIHAKDIFLMSKINLTVPWIRFNNWYRWKEKHSSRLALLWGIFICQSKSTKITFIRCEITMVHCANSSSNCNSRNQAKNTASNGIHQIKP